MGCSSNKHKTCRDKSCQRYYNNNPQSFVAGQVLNLQIAGNRVVDTGVSIETQGQSMTTLKTGLYHISADVVISVTAASTGTLQVYMDGVPLPCTLRDLTLVAGANPVHVETDLPIEGCCCDVSHTFTFVFTSGTAVGSVLEFCCGILKLA